MKNNKIIKTLILALCAALIMTTVCFADENKYASNAADWLLDGVFWVAIVVGVWQGGLVSMLFQRNFTKGILILVCAGVTCWLCKDPQAFQRIGNVLKGVIGV